MAKKRKWEMFTDGEKNQLYWAVTAGNFMIKVLPIGDMRYVASIYTTFNKHALMQIEECDIIYSDLELAKEAGENKLREIVQIQVDAIMGNDMAKKLTDYEFFEELVARCSKMDNGLAFTGDEEEIQYIALHMLDNDSDGMIDVFFNFDKDKLDNIRAYYKKGIGG